MVNNEVCQSDSRRIAATSAKLYRRHHQSHHSNYLIKRGQKYLNWSRQKSSWKEAAWKWRIFIGFQSPKLHRLSVASRSFRESNWWFRNTRSFTFNFILNCQLLLFFFLIAKSNANMSVESANHDCVGVMESPIRNSRDCCKSTISFICSGLWLIFI